MSFGDETVTFAEKDIPRCTRVYGEAPCAAKLGVTGDVKCHNSPATCQDAANYLAETQTIRFSRDQDGLRDYGYAIPSIVSLDTTPAKINLAGMDENASALGAREQVTVRFADHKHSDNTLDKYRLERAFAAAIRWPGRWRPASFRLRGGAQAGAEAARASFFGEYDIELDPYRQGTYWGKFVARHPYYTAFALRIREGVVGDALADMRVRNYVVHGIDGPKDGSVTLTARDLLSKLEARKAVAPFPSLGELTAAITGTPATFTVGPAGIGDLTPEEGGYSTITNVVSGYVTIGDEAIEVTRVGDTFTVVERGALGTVAVDHDDDDLVQLGLEYDAELVQDIIYDLALGYSYVTGESIDKPAWDAAAADLDDLYTARILKPTPVEDLIGELCRDSGITLVPNVVTGMIDFLPLRAGVISPVVTDATYIVDGSLSVRRDDSQRVSTVMVYYGLKNHTDDIDDEHNYHSRYLQTDQAAAALYGSDEVRVIKSRWIPQFGRDLAQRCAERVLAMYVDPPIKATFKVTKDRADDFGLARYFYLQTAEVQDASGAPRLVPMAAVSIARGENEIMVEGQSVAFTADPVGGVHTIHIENNANNITLRSIYDSLFAEPTGTEEIEFIVDETIVVGSTSTGTPAMRTGTWPAMTTPPRLTNLGRIQGKGADGGAGGNTAGSGLGGGTGGDAILVEAIFEIDNTSGAIWSGGGGGGGGGGAGNAKAPRGGGGGGGSGTNAGAGAIGGGGLGNPGSAGTDATGGGGGGGGANGFGTSGSGGNGGGPGLVGQNGGPGDAAPGGAGGAAGKYVDGNSFVTWVAVGDVRGNVG